jgi:hypothetical protein
MHELCPIQYSRKLAIAVVATAEGTMQVAQAFQQQGQLLRREDQNSR